MREMDTARVDAADVEQQVRRLVAETTGTSCEAGALLGDTSLDSLTLMAIVTRIEAAFAISFDGDEVVALLGAQDLGALARLVARKVAAATANLCESPGNEGC